MQIDGQCHRGSRQIWCRSAVPWIKDIEELPGRTMD
jgi:hypothetical protein